MPRLIPPRDGREILDHAADGGDFFPCGRGYPRPFDLAVREADAALAEANIRLRGNLASDCLLLPNHEDEERQRNAITLSGIPAAQVRLERAQLDRERTAITAPFDGVVDRVDDAASQKVRRGPSPPP